MANPWSRRDAFFAATVGVIAFMLALLEAPVLPRALLRADELHSVWFEADPGQAMADMLSRPMVTDTSLLHPLYPLLAYAPTKTLRLVTGLDPLPAALGVMAAIAGIWFAALFGMLRMMDVRRFDALMLTGVAGSSAAALFWFGVPETFPLGSLSLMLALGLAAAARRGAGPRWYLLANVLTFATTVTNWVAGLAATRARFPTRHAVTIATAAIAVVIVLGVAQHRLLGYDMFLTRLDHHQEFMLDPDAIGPVPILRSMVFHTVVMPEFVVTNRYDRSLWPILVTQPARPGSAGPWGAVAVVLWTAMLAAGVWSMRQVTSQRRLAIVVAVTLAGQIALHLVWGDETFLYALHFLPLWILVVAFATLTRARRAVLALSAALIVCATVNNVRQLHEAHAVVRQLAEAARADDAHGWGGSRSR